MGPIFTWEIVDILFRLVYKTKERLTEQYCSDDESVISRPVLMLFYAAFASK